MALVLLRSPGGLPGAAAAVAGRLERHLPEPGAAERAASALAEAGFEVGPVVGISFSIAGPPELFRARLGIDPVPSAGGAWTAAGGAEVPGGELPAALAGDVEAVVFEEPVELLDGE
ncbi:hypothetical protein ACQ7DA_00545 [Zafaria sp. J156]|uniref:hypothetical protein n=1 Tax=Zafaria sp. J156 TaxID=3116490 RepID=UPI002EB51A7C|nr:hypothetical protein [Zafaria sp. J156]